MIFYVGGTTDYSGEKYRIEFRHEHKGTKRGAKRLRLIQGIRGETICVVVKGDYVGIGHVYCSDTDNFSREAGRFKALKQALRECKRIPREHIPILLEMYQMRPRPRTEGLAFAVEIVDTTTEITDEGKTTDTGAA